jgi:hypothetical protein
MPTSSKDEKQKRVAVSAGYSYRRQAVALEANRRVTAADETQSSAPPPNSRLLSADGYVCPHTTYVRELASQTA